jgi:PAS domain S-box-containing protein
MLRAFNRPFLRRWSARAQLAAVVESADDAIISKDLNGIITSWNSAAERMFGHTAAEAVGRPITIIIPPDRLHEEVEILSRLRRGEAIRHFETERVRKDGQRVPISLAISPMRDRNGRVIGASKIARDITERRRSEQALREAMQRLAGLYRLADEVGRAKEIGQVCEAAVESIVAGGADRASIPCSTTKASCDSGPREGCRPHTSARSTGIRHGGAIRAIRNPSWSATCRSTPRSRPFGM